MCMCNGIHEVIRIYIKNVIKYEPYRGSMRYRVHPLCLPLAEL